MKMLGKIERSVLTDSLESPSDRAETGRKPGTRPIKAISETPLQARRSQNQVDIICFKRTQKNTSWGREFSKNG